MDTPSLRLLASSSNQRGDLFTRLVKDLFFALGYDELRLNVHKTGRELDVEGIHRLEPQRLAAECKAHAKKIGGDALNKFFGALTRERKKHHPTPVTGYFVSLGGFKESGIEQEHETGDDRLILLGAQSVIEELERSPMLIGKAQAAEKAGHCAEHAGLEDAVLDGIELLGHEKGYLWAVFYSHGKELTHFALIHADGLVVTSREAGFRLVAGVVASVCTRAQLGRFDADDVRRLCERWHVELSSTMGILS
jgi:hypothetical protein